MKIIVASTNPVKINCTLLGFQAMMPDIEFEIEGISVDSGVSDQPMTSKDTESGALSRLKAAKKEKPDADFWVGIEAGIEEDQNNLITFAWIFITDGKFISKSRTGDFTLPHKINELVRSGIELGTADDMVFGKVNSKQSNGTVGQLTKDIITRTEYYKQTVILALIPFVNKKYYI